MLWRQMITSMGFQFFLIFVSVGIVGTVVLILFGSIGLVRKSLIETGVPTEAEVVGVGTDSEPGDSSSVCVEFRYRDQHGTPQSGQDTVSRNVPGNVTKGSKIAIRFDPEKPSRSAASENLQPG